MPAEQRRGGCLCGGVTYTVSGPVSGPSICHCSQCRKQSGHVWASAHAPADRVAIHGPVQWYASSKAARRGFCPTCGAFLFWRHLEEDTLSFSLGSLEAPTGVRLEKHIFVADKGEYYDIADGLPQSP